MPPPAALRILKPLSVLKWPPAARVLREHLPHAHQSLHLGQLEAPLRASPSLPTPATPHASVFLMSTRHAHEIIKMAILHWHSTHFKAAILLPPASSTAEAHATRLPPPPPPRGRPPKQRAAFGRTRQLACTRCGPACRRPAAGEEGQEWDGWVRDAVRTVTCASEEQLLSGST